MRFMVLVPANAESEAGELPDEKMLAAMGKFNEEMVNAGLMLAGEGLQATSKGARLHFEKGKVSVVEGPFYDKNLVAGFWMIQCKSKQEAIDWMKRAPFGDRTVLEIRQVFETEDFAPSDPTGEHRAHEERMRTKIAGTK